MSSQEEKNAAILEVYQWIGKSNPIDVQGFFNLFSQLEHGQRKNKSVVTHFGTPSEAAQHMITVGDTTGNGFVDEDEFKRAARTNTDFHQVVNHLVINGITVHQQDPSTGYTTKKHKTFGVTKWDKFKMKYHVWPPKLFMFLTSLVQFAVFVHYTRGDCENVNTECPKTYTGWMTYRMCCRSEVYRFFTYSLMHSGVPHVGFNIVIQCLFGIPLELKHGTRQVAILYVIGIIAGSIGSSVIDPEANLVGASGAVYTIIGAQVGAVMLNYDTMYMPVPRTLILLCFCVLDLGNQVYKHYTADEPVSYAAHFVGFAIGLSFGCYILDNEKRRYYEVYYSWAGVSITMAMLIFGLVWNFKAAYDPHGLCFDSCDDLSTFGPGRCEAASGCFWEGAEDVCKGILSAGQGSRCEV
jgi:rhomboid-related protein 1/2/3